MTMMIIIARPRGPRKSRSMSRSLHPRDQHVMLHVNVHAQSRTRAPGGSRLERFGKSSIKGKSRRTGRRGRGLGHLPS